MFIYDTLADNSNTLNRMYHSSSLALAILTPIALISVNINETLTQACDYALAILLPYHSHVGLNYVISDYVPMSVRSTARFTLLGCTMVGVVGLLKANVQGHGLLHSTYQLWNSKQVKKD